MDRDEDDDEGMLLDLLQTGQIVVNCYHWEKSWPKEAQDCIAIAVNCNDLFGPAADAEHLPHSELRRAWQMHVSDPEHCRGLMAWCVSRRRTMPWSKGMRVFAGSKWDIAALAA